MQVILKVCSGASANRMVVLRPGQTLKVGRTSWADLTIADDDSLADVHFSLDCGPAGCTLQPLAEGEPVLLNGEESGDTPLNDGDQILAGRTTFVVSVEGAAKSDDEEEHVQALDSKGSGYKMIAIVSAAEIAAECDLEEKATELLEENDNPREYIDRLMTNKCWTDALAFLAAALPKQEAVWWACSCTTASDDPMDQSALQTARDWVADPTEENRRAAEKAATDAKVLTPAVCTAMAAFVSGGSLAPPDLPEAPPPANLTANTVAATIKSAAVFANPHEADANRRRFLELGLAVAEGENRWE